MIYLFYLAKYWHIGFKIVAHPSPPPREFLPDSPHVNYIDFSTHLYLYVNVWVVINIVCAYSVALEDLKIWKMMYNKRLQRRNRLGEEKIPVLDRYIVYFKYILFF